jgi:hypothetical protein
MNHEELTRIVKIANVEQIRQKMFELGYRDAKQDEKLKAIPSVTIIQSTIDDTDQFLSDDEQYCFDGHKSINNDVAFGVEFITIQTMEYNKKRKMYITSGFDIYAKEITA